MTVAVLGCDNIKNCDKVISRTCGRIKNNFGLDNWVTYNCALLKYTIPAPGLLLHEVPNDWYKENVRGVFAISIEGYSTISFEDKDEAAMFKLTWL